MCANLMTAIPCEMVCECGIVLYGTSVGVCVCVCAHACVSVSSVPINNVYARENAACSFCMYVLLYNISL